MDYHKTAPFAGDKEKALEMAKTVFMNNNFRLEQSGAGKITARGTSFYDNQKNPLRGVSYVEVRAEAGQIQLSAELGGIRRLRNFMLIFPFGLALTLSILFFFLDMPGPAAGVPWFAVAPWLILAPLFSVFFRRRTIGALDNLLHNISLAESSQYGRRP